MGEEKLIYSDHSGKILDDYIVVRIERPDHFITIKGNHFVGPKPFYVAPNELVPFVAGLKFTENDIPPSVIVKTDMENNG